MNDVEVPGIVNVCVVQNLFRRFKEDDTGLED